MPTLILVGVSQFMPQRTDLPTLARTWTHDFSVRGIKTEATFVEDVRYARSGDDFSLSASIYGQDTGVVALSLDQSGQVSGVDCSSLAGCGATSPPNGFLATVTILAALRSGRLTGDGDVVSYAGRSAVCVPLDAIQSDLTTPVVLDPCFDMETGAVLAHRRRFDGQFGGATLDESSLQLLTTPSSSYLSGLPEFLNRTVE